MQKTMTLKQIEKITMTEALSILKKNNIPVTMKDANSDVMAKARNILRDDRKKERMTTQLLGSYE
jgi:hypothetical protein